jgi:hypothetical protein
MNAALVPVASVLALFTSSTNLRAQQPSSAPVEPQPTPQPTPPLAADATPQTTPPPAPPAKGLQWVIGETKIKLGGYIKVDLIHDFDEIGSTDSFDPRTIPTDDSEGTATRIHARQTRFNLDVQSPTTAGPMRAFVEGDFFGSGNSFRLRHAYGTVGPVLAGQTWSTFMDEDAMPETLDFESPIAFPLIRQAQIRYKHDLGDGSYAAFSLEDPDSEVIPPTGVTGQTDEPLPDFNARLRFANDRGHVQLGAFLGMARFEPDAGSSEDVFLWGLNLSTKYAVFGEDNVFLQATYGDGVGRYRGGSTAAADADGDIEAITTLGLMGGYEHHWSDEYRSTLSYSWGTGDLPDGSPTDTTEEVTYLAANFIWQFADRAWTGIEYLYGSRDTFDGEDGDANRIQISVRFDL